VVDRQCATVQTPGVGTKEGFTELGEGLLSG